MSTPGAPSPVDAEPQVRAGVCSSTRKRFKATVGVEGSWATKKCRHQHATEGEAWACADAMVAAGVRP